LQSLARLVPFDLRLDAGDPRHRDAGQVRRLREGQVAHAAQQVDLLGEQVDEVAAVLIVEKDRLPGVAAGGDVIDGAGELEAKGRAVAATVGGGGVQSQALTPCPLLVR